MYRPSHYNIHNESLEKFCNLFNECPEYEHIKMYPITEETFIDDGYFLNTHTGEKIGFDWEYRANYFQNGKFSFDTLGQYERKIIKPSIDISLQCDSTQTAIAVAWHNDFYIEPQVRIRLETDYSEKENGKTRYTKKFKIFMYEDMITFKKMINKAFNTGNKNSSVF